MIAEQENRQDIDALLMSEEPIIQEQQQQEEDEEQGDCSDHSRKEEDQVGAGSDEGVKAEESSEIAKSNATHSAISPHSAFAIWIRAHLSDLDITGEEDCRVVVEFLVTKVRSLKMLSKITKDKFDKILEIAGISDIVIEDVLRELHNRAVSEFSVSDTVDIIITT